MLVTVKDGVDHALHIRLLAVLDVGEDPASRGLLDERVLVGGDVGDHRARGLLDNRRDQIKSVTLVGDQDTQTRRLFIHQIRVPRLYSPSGDFAILAVVRSTAKGPGGYRAAQPHGPQNWSAPPPRLTFRQLKTARGSSAERTTP